MKRSMVLCSRERFPLQGDENSIISYGSYWPAGSMAGMVMGEAPLEENVGREEKSIYGDLTVKQMGTGW